jgi:predicted nucleic acid-binding protein
VTVVLDASTLINLANGEVFAKIVSLPGRSFQVSPTVLKESLTVAKAIRAAVKRGDIALVDDGAIDASEFERALEEWGLGSGETECILAARVLACSVACDDGAARRIIERELGSARLTGSVGLLRDAVSAGLLTAQDAYDAFLRMKQLGGYLPTLALSDFQP